MSISRNCYVAMSNLGVKEEPIYVPHSVRGSVQTLKFPGSKFKTQLMRLDYFEKKHSYFIYPSEHVIKRFSIYPLQETSCR